MEQVKGLIDVVLGVLNLLITLKGASDIRKTRSRSGQPQDGLKRWLYIGSALILVIGCLRLTWSGYTHHREGLALKEVQDTVRRANRIELDVCKQATSLDSITLLSKLTAEFDPNGTAIAGVVRTVKKLQELNHQYREDASVLLEFVLPYHISSDSAIVTTNEVWTIPKVDESGQTVISGTVRQMPFPRQEYTLTRVNDKWVVKENAGVVRK